MPRGAPGALQIRNAKPGILSEELRAALGMGDNTPPPWLINMQRYGPPPSYPDLRVSTLRGFICCNLSSSSSLAT